MNHQNSTIEKEVATAEQEPITFSLGKKYPELTTTGWRQALEFTKIAERELRLDNSQTVQLLISLVKNF